MKLTMLNDALLWTKIGRIVARLSERLDIAPEEAFNLFYTSETNSRLHNPKDYLYLMSDLYIVDEVMKESRGEAFVCNSCNSCNSITP